MVPAIIEDPLGVDCVFSDGATTQFHLNGLPNPRLARDLLVGLVGRSTHKQCGCRRIGGPLCARDSGHDPHTRPTGFTGTASDLRRARLAEYWIDLA